MFRQSEFESMEMPSVIEFHPHGGLDDDDMSDAERLVGDDEESTLGRGQTDDERETGFGPSADGRKFDEDEDDEVDFELDEDADDEDESADADADEEFDDDDDEFDDDLDDDDDDDDDFDDEE